MSYFTKHGQARRTGWSSEYIAWKNMIARCEQISSDRYKAYGGRGIKVCRRWRVSFEAFFQDMGPKPSAKHSIGRADVHKGYYPKNCRWETAAEQSRNKTTTKYLIVGGRKVSLIDAAADYGITYNTLKRRLLRGWSGDRAVTEPLRRW